MALSYWDLLFDHDHAQRRDIEALKERAHSSEAELYRRFGESQQRMARMELLCEALIELLRVKGVLDRDELALMIQRIDLADGIEDGRIGPDLSKKAPRCGHCMRPVNPKREACLYCGTPMKAPEKPSPSERTTSCRKCQKQILESEAYFSGSGMLCEPCHFGV